MAITKFCCGAECGITSAGAGPTSAKHWNVPVGVPTVETDIVRSGLRAFKMTTAAGATVAVTKDVLPAASQNKVATRFYLYFESLPDADCIVFQVDPTGTGSSATVVFEFEDSSIGAGWGASDAGGRVPVTTGVWYRIELLADISTGTHTCDVSVDGVAVNQASRVLAADTFLRARWGMNAVTTVANGTIRIDDIHVEFGVAGDAFTWPIGAGRVIPLSPNADGTHSYDAAGDFCAGADGATTDLGAAATNAHSFIDERPITGVDDMLGVKGAVQDEYLEFQYEDLPGDQTITTIHCVAHVSSHKNASDATSNRASLRLVDGGSTAEIVNNLDFSETSPVFHEAVFAEAPSGGAWTRAKVDALKSRFAGSFSGQTHDIAPIPQLFGAMFEVSTDAVDGGGGPEPIMIPSRNVMVMGGR